MEQRFYICRHCGNIIAFVDNKGVPVMCCGSRMEKHVPVVTVEGQLVTVDVGAVAHPMTPEHSIQWVSLQTKFGNQRKALKPGDAPQVRFAICEGDEVVAAYAYCNLHGLWKS